MEGAVRRRERYAGGGSFHGVSWFCMRLNVNMTYRHLRLSRRGGLETNVCYIWIRKKKMLANEIFVLLQHGTVDRPRLVLSVLTTV